MEIADHRMKLIKKSIKIFNAIIQTKLDPTFILSNGGVTIKAINKCLDKLTEIHSTISDERLVDFWVCQAYRAYQAGWETTSKYGISYYCGDVAIDTYTNTTHRKFYYIDNWLDIQCSRKYLVSLICNRTEHPLYKYIYPEYEEYSKNRLLGTDAGYMICGQTTMGWTPFSRVCVKCTYTERCKERTKTMFPELYRIREEEFNEAE